MSVADPKCFVRLKEPIPALDHVRYVDHRQFAVAHCVIDRIAGEIGVSRLNDFYVYDGEYGSTPLQWHSADDGLAAIRAVTSHIQSHEDIGISPESRTETLAVLSRIEHILSEAADRDIAFCVVGNY